MQRVDILVQKQQLLLQDLREITEYICSDEETTQYCMI